MNKLCVLDELTTPQLADGCRRIGKPRRFAPSEVQSPSKERRGARPIQHAVLMRFWKRASAWKVATNEETSEMAAV